VSAVTDLRALDTLTQLVAAEEEYASLARRVDELLHAAAAVRGRAEALASVLDRAGPERERLAAALAEAEGLVREREQTLREAEVELGAARNGRDEGRLKAAERFTVRARDALTSAQRHAGLARQAVDEHKARVDAARRAVPEVETEAGKLAGLLRGLPRLAPGAATPPQPGLGGVVEWARAARAALTVARSSVSSERDALIRQANELGSVLLGQPLAASSVDLVRRQVEAAATQSS
jgi:hypothetical protein